MPEANNKIGCFLLLEGAIGRWFFSCATYDNDCDTRKLNVNQPFIDYTRGLAQDTRHETQETSSLETLDLGARDLQLPVTF